MVNQLCELTDWYQFSWISTHDLVIIPFTEWATKGSISYVQSNSEWANYMQWIVIIVHVDWWWEVYPVRSLETWKMKWRENPSC
jgi:hypothetical protein